MTKRAEFSHRLREDVFPVTYEVISPRGADVGPYVDRVAALPILKRLAAVNVTNNPSARVRIDPAAFGHLLADQVGVDVIAHVTCRDDNLAGIQSRLFGAWALGIRNLLVMTGDHPSCGDYPEEKRVDSLNSIELIAGIRRFLSKGSLIPDVVSLGSSRYGNRFDVPQAPKRVEPVSFFVGSPLIPWRNNELSYARAKRGAGAEFFQTQITWDEQPVLEFLAKAEESKVLGDAPVLVGVSPLKNERTMEFMTKEIPNITVPPSVQSRLRAAKDFAQESVDVVIEMVGRLRDGAKSRGIKTKLGLHVLPINDDALGCDIVERARRA